MTAPVTPMEARCAACLDTGSLSKWTGGDLDCTHCKAAEQRGELNATVEAARKVAMGEYRLASFDAVWFAYQLGQSASVEQPAMPTLPSTPEDVIDFLGTNIEHMDAVGDIEDRRITLSVHDLLSAFQELADAQPIQQVEAVGQINQWRKCGCSDWYDGFPDPEDGGGPYETRMLYAAQQPVAQQAGDVARDAANWRTFERVLRTGHIPGAAHGRRFKIIETCAMSGNENEFNDFIGAINAMAKEKA